MKDQSIYDKYCEEHNYCVWEYVILKDSIIRSDHYQFYCLNEAFRDLFNEIVRCFYVDKVSRWIESKLINKKAPRKEITGGKKKDECQESILSLRESIHYYYYFVKEFCMKKIITVLIAVLFIGCSQPGSGLVEPVEFHEYPGNTLVFECMTMVNLSPTQVYESKWVIPTGTTLRFVIINSDYMIFLDTPDVNMITNKDIIIEGDGTLKTARLKVLTPPTDLHYPSIAVWYNDDYSLIDYEISK